MQNYLRTALIFSAFVFGFFPAQSWAREVKYKDFALELREGDRLIVTGLNGSVKFTPNSRALARGAGETFAPAEGAPGNGTVRVRKSATAAAANEAFDSWTFTVRRDGTAVRVEAKGPEGKNEWEQQMKSGAPELHFDIDAPAVPLEVAFRNGSVTVNQLKSSIQIQLVEGQVRLSKNEGTLRAQVGRGEVKIDSHKGRVEVDGFSPKVIASQIEGELSVDNFAGESSLQTVKGHLQVTTFSGQTMASKVDGGVDFQVGRGTLNLQDLSGNLRGKLDNGSLIAKISGEPEVNVESQEGGVSLDITSNASPSVRLQTEEGNLVAPGDLAQSKAGGQKMLAGKLNGGGDGSIFVKTKTGNVRIY